MSVEKVLLTTNIKQVQRILSFHETLVVKNEVEASLLETKDSYVNYTNYLSAYQKTDTFYDYPITEGGLLEFGFTAAEIPNVLDRRILNEMVGRGDERANAYLAVMRKDRITNFSELNGYYRPFMGKPRDESEFIYVLNEDSGPTQVPIHLITSALYPATYDRLFTKKNIVFIIRDNPDLLYLKFLMQPLTPFYVRESPQYTILFYTQDVLTADEASCYFKSYEKMRNYVLTVDYVNGYDQVDTTYSNIMLFMLLFGAFMLFCNSYIESYGLRNYTDSEIYDILKSNGLESLSSINIKTLRKVVMNLPELMALKGSDQVLEKILDVISAQDVIVKRYYLTKKYKTDNTGQIHIDPNKPYEENVDLEFVENIIHGNTQNSEKLRIPYHEFIVDDDTWGGAVDVHDPAAKYALKEKLRIEILRMDFSSMITKYVNISKVVELYSKEIRISDLFSLMLQANEESLFLYTDKLQFNGVETTPMTLYAAFCWLTGRTNGIANSEVIVKEAQMIDDLMILRNRTGLAILVDNIANEPIVIGGDGKSLKLGDILRDVNILDYIVSFGYTLDTPVYTILSQYDENSLIVNAIREHMAESTETDEYAAWARMLQINMISTRIDNLFGGKSTYPEYILEVSPNFYNLIEPTINASSINPAIDDGNRADLCAQVSAAFRTYVSDKTNGVFNIPTYAEMVNGGNNDLDDVKLLLKEFTSIYTELYKIEFYQGFADVPFNSLTATFDKVSDIFRLLTQDVIDIDSVADHTFLSETEDTIVVDEDPIDMKGLAIDEDLIPISSLMDPNSPYQVILSIIKSLQIDQDEISPVHNMSDGLTSSFGDEIFTDHEIIVLDHDPNSGNTLTLPQLTLAKRNYGDPSTTYDYVLDGEGPESEHTDVVEGTE